MIVALLRAINIGGRRVTNDRLVAIAESAGFERVGAYQAAGNLLLEAHGADPEVVERALEVTLTDELAYPVEVFVRTRAQLVAAIDDVPFDALDVEEATSKPQIGFLRTPAPPDVAAEVRALATDTDQLEVVGRHLHWLPIGGMGRSPVDTTALGRLLGPMTLRSTSTVTRLITKL